MRLSLQLTVGISKVIQKLLKYFNGTTILTSFVLPAAGVFPLTLILDSNDLEFIFNQMAHLYNIA